MKTCIFTIIKNEHQYLDEWIQYHLNIGIDHIFIYEDIDSDSHKEITDKYNNVTLDSISNILTQEEKQKAIELKLTKKSSVHNLYLKKGLLYMHEQYSNIYDWCFATDNDEFIMLEDKGINLKDVLNLYNSYDAIVLFWKCFGADGHIKKPDYSKSTIETYVNECQCKNIEKPDCFVRTAYNLKTYKNEFYHNCHHPNNICNWCNTNYEKDNINIMYKNMYLNHYITKSWEEYMWKIKERGFMWGGRRNIDFFFIVNPDLLYKKDELLKELNNDTLIILPYKQSSSQGNELRLTLILWKKFCTFEYRFVVIGEFDNNLKTEFPWVEFIECPTRPKKEGQYNPHLDIQNKMNIVMKKYSSIYDGFIYMTDDEYAIKPFELSDITKIYYHQLSFTGNESAPTSYWCHDKWKTRQLLDKENLPHINYTTHYPYYMEFDRLKELWKNYNMLEESYVFDDVYFNSFEHEEPILDSTIRLGIWNYNIYKNEFQKALENPNIKFICNSVEGWSKDLEKDLLKLINYN